MALTTLAEVKAFLNITSSAQDTWLTALKGAAEQNIKDYCQQYLESTTWTHFLTGNGQRLVVLKERPVTSITSVYLHHDGNFGFSSGAFPSTTMLTAGTDYSLVLDGTLPDGSTAASLSGLVVRINTVWPELDRPFPKSPKLALDVVPKPGNIKITYVAGYPTIPEDLKYATAMLVRYYQMTGKLGGMPLESEKIGDYAYRLGGLYRYSTMPEIGAIRQILHRYRDVAM